MPARFLFVAVIAVLAQPALAADEGRHLKIIPARGLGAIESATVYRTLNGKRTVVVTVRKFDQLVALGSEGPFEVVIHPKGGLPVRVVEKLTVKAGAVHELKVGDHLGAVEVLGDDLPRAERIVLTDVKDPGPGEKGHVAIQSAADYRVDLLAPPGAYAVWVVPANGARPQRVVENVRVQAGRSVRVGD
jgi:hypothetical protein